MLEYLQRRGINRGLFGGRKGWFYVGIGVWGLRRLISLSRGGAPEILISEALKPGERMIIAAGRATLDSPVKSQG